MANDAVIDWLMAGDPVIRWQIMRDLGEEGVGCRVWGIGQKTSDPTSYSPLPTPILPSEMERERAVDVGWGAEFLSHRQPDGRWPKGRWSDTVWTLLTVMDCGLPSTEPRLTASAQLFIDHHVTRQAPFDEKWMLTRMDLCHLGFWLRIGGYFDIDEPRLVEMATVVLRQQMDDGGWNCRRRGYPKTRHGSFHTTFNVLEGLKEFIGSREWGVGNRGSANPASPLPTPHPLLPIRFADAEARAAEFMLCHRMYRSDRTGDVVDEKFTYLTFPSHWHYTVLRGLDYLRSTPCIADPRLDDPIAMLVGRRGVDGRWPVEKRIAGVELFDMERMGGESRWNTLRMLRVLKARGDRDVGNGV